MSANDPFRTFVSGSSEPSLHGWCGTGEKSISERVRTAEGPGKLLQGSSGSHTTEMTRSAAAAGNRQRAGSQAPALLSLPRSAQRIEAANAITIVSLTISSGTGANWRLARTFGMIIPV